MANKIFETNGRPIKAWLSEPIEEQALAQLTNCANMPFIHKHVAVMPDVHAGMGATIGSVIPTVGAIIPAAVGVDIGCGMLAYQTNLTAEDLPDDLGPLRAEIERRIPHGRTDHGGRNDRGAWGDLPNYVSSSWYSLEHKEDFKYLQEHHPKIFKTRGGLPQNTARHLGTLGGGNHFVEVCLDTEDNVWIMLHSGSRGIGNRIGSYFIELAKKDMERYFVNLPDKDLAYFPEGTNYFDDYIRAVGWAQDFAHENRIIMGLSVVDAICTVMADFFEKGKEFQIVGEVINCHHNYVEKENHYGKNVWVTRKGAVRAREGDVGIIPGSMGAKSFIVRGKGNPESFCSCSHGAGRRMSRTKARHTFSVEDHIKATEGVECRKDADVLDEIPMAYKDIDGVIQAQSDLVEVVHTLKQILCVKG